MITHHFLVDDLAPVDTGNPFGSCQVVNVVVFVSQLLHPLAQLLHTCLKKNKKNTSVISVHSVSVYILIHLQNINALMPTQQVKVIGRNMKLWDELAIKKTFNGETTADLVPLLASCNM